MASVQFHGWRPGLNKIALSHALRHCAGLSLSDAKQAVDLILEGQAVDIAVESLEAGRELVREATEVGAECRLLETSANGAQKPAVHAG